MNTLIPLFFITLFITLGIIGLVFTARNTENLNKDLSNKKIIAQFYNLEIRDTENLKMAFWSGTMKIYEDRILIENGSYFHHFIKRNIAHKKKAMTITLDESFIDNDRLILKGIKHRVLHNSLITVKIKTTNSNDLIKIKELIT
ncbi:hypothetical protein M4I21_10570 [Cellulophaga sp. 20_2_10]|uniref:hypothetical protein n=1 Tax=Cellulophaga sp. 20_2_10 TaxID=2942476 RepID=UPI00201AD472|nr:hypothetical protein [Cellulophaga sp. 20_2_10]MCL5246253.1 hypothetical protein [Cellulophaga sp. 20_2_10]